MRYLAQTMSRLLWVVTSTSLLLFGCLEIPNREEVDQSPLLDSLDQSIIIDAGEADLSEVDSGEVDLGEADLGEVDSGEVDSGAHLAPPFMRVSYHDVGSLCR